MTIIANILAILYDNNSKYIILIYTWKLYPHILQKTINNNENQFYRYRHIAKGTSRESSQVRKLDQISA